jgi:hypothetical protein
MRAAVGPKLPDQALSMSRPVNAHLMAVKMRLITIPRHLPLYSLAPF